MRLGLPLGKLALGELGELALGELALANLNGLKDHSIGEDKEGYSES